jgi:NAD(P)-dependent dehydrogenase (short-subunit alcohol dehydrogenase family)
MTPPRASLQGRVAVVTGAARNIGRAIATRLGNDGATVIFVDVDQAVEEASARAAESGIDAHSELVDVSSQDDVSRLFGGIKARFGRVDILVNNAAIVRGAVRHFLEADEAWWDRVTGVNLKGQFLCSHAAASIMASQRKGVIVNMSSGGATRAHRGMAAYDASKGGSEALTRALALDLAPYGIRVVSVVPGLISQDGQSEESIKLAAETVPLGRIGTPDDVAAGVAFLVSDDAAYVTGAALVIDGALLSQQRSPQVETFPPSAYPDPP